MTARGTTAAPEISGVAALDGASVTVRGYAEPVREIHARLTASPAGLRLVEARGVLGGGTVTASGEAALADGGLGAYRVALKAQRVAATPLDGLSTLWDGDLELAGRATRALLQGELRLVRGIYTGELAPAAGGPQGSTAGLPSGGAALPLRIAVKLDDNLVVRNRTASLRIGGTLFVEGSTAAPAVLGTLETREGRVTFRDRRFTILTATARFVDPRRIDPFLDATATARIREYDVTARVSGRTDQLDVRLSSTPPLPQEDLLALVAFGATRTELERSPAGVLAEEAARTIVRDLLGLQGLPGTGGGDGGEPAAPGRNPDDARADDSDRRPWDGERRAATGAGGIPAPWPAESGRRARDEWRLHRRSGPAAPIPMRARRGAIVALAATLWLAAPAGPDAARAQDGARAVVTGVDLMTAAGVPESLVRSAIGDMVGRPRSREAVRESLERLWALGLFADILVEEVDAPEGIRLRYHLTPRPLVRRIVWQGDAGLDLGQLVTAASLALGEEASPERLARAREDLLVLYRREGYLDARVEVEAVPVPGEAGKDVTVLLSAGIPGPARAGPSRRVARAAREDRDRGARPQPRRPIPGGGGARTGARARGAAAARGILRGSRHSPPAQPGRRRAADRPDHRRRCGPAIRGDLRRTARPGGVGAPGPSDRAR